MFCWPHALITVSLALRLGPVLWMLVQPSAFIELALATEAYDALSAVEYEDILNRSTRALRQLQDRVCPPQLALGSLLLVHSQILFYAVAVVAGEVLWFGQQTVVGYVTAEHSVLSASGQDYLSFVSRCVSVAAAFVVC